MSIPAGPTALSRGGGGVLQKREDSVQCNCDKRGLGLSRRWEGESWEGNCTFCALTHQYDRTDMDIKREFLISPGPKAGGPLSLCPRNPYAAGAVRESRWDIPVSQRRRPSCPPPRNQHPHSSAPATSRRPRSRSAALSPGRKTPLRGPLSTAACGLYLAN